MKAQTATAAILFALACGAAAHAGQGAGNAHGAATAGMTYQGDPVSGPTSPWPVHTRTESANRHDGADSSPDPSKTRAAPKAKDQ